MRMNEIGTLIAAICYLIKIIMFICTKGHVIRLNIHVIYTYLNSQKLLFTGFLQNSLFERFGIPMLGPFLSLAGRL